MYIYSQKRIYLINKLQMTVSFKLIYLGIFQGPCTAFECITFLVCGTMALQHSTHLTACSRSVPGDLKLTKVLTHRAHKE